MQIVKLAVSLFGFGAMAACSAPASKPATSPAAAVATQTTTPMTSPPVVAGSGSASASASETDSGSKDAPPSTLPPIAPGVGQLTIALPDDVDPASVNGYVIDEAADAPSLTLKRAVDNTWIIDNVPPGEHDVVILAGTLAVAAALTESAPTRGVRLNAVAFAAGARKELGPVALPLLGSISGKALLQDPPAADQNLGIHVFVPGTGFSADTAENGAYKIDGVPAGTHRLRFKLSPYFTGRADKIIVEAEKDTRVPDIELVKMTGVNGFIQLNAGQAASGSATVTVNVGASADASLMAFSEDAAFTGKTYGPLLSTTTYTFTGDGPHKLFVRFANDAGQETSFESNTVTIDTAAPTAVIGTPPASDSALTTLGSAISGGDGLNANDATQFRYKLGAMSSTDCSAESGYSAATPSSSPLAANFSGFADGALRLCVVAGDALGHFQPFASATTTTWTKDTTGPVATASSPANGAPDVAPGSALLLTLDEPVANATPTKADFPVKAGDRVVYATPSLTGNATEVSFSLYHDRLAARTSYTMGVASTVTDALGNHSPARAPYTFTTGAGFKWPEALFNDHIYMEGTPASADSPIAVAESRNGKRAIAFVSGSYGGVASNRISVAIFNGSVWSTPAVPPNLAAVHGMAPKIGIDDDGRVVLSLFTFDDSVTYKLVALTYAPSPTPTWSALEELNPNAGKHAAIDFDLAVAPDGHAFVIEKQAHAVVAHHFNGISTWVASTLSSGVTQNGAQVVVRANSGHKAVAAYNLDEGSNTYRFNAKFFDVDAAGAWSAAPRVMGAAASIYLGSPVAGIDDDGKSYLAWLEAGATPTVIASTCAYSSGWSCTAKTLQSGTIFAQPPSFQLNLSVSASARQAFVAWRAERDANRTARFTGSDWDVKELGVTGRIAATAIDGDGRGYLALQEEDLAGDPHRIVTVVSAPGSSTFGARAIASYGYDCDTTDKGSYFPAFVVAGATASTKPATLFFAGCADHSASMGNPTEDTLWSGFRAVDYAP